MFYLDDCFCLSEGKKNTKFVLFNFFKWHKRLRKNFSCLKHLCIFQIHFSRGIRHCSPHKPFCISNKGICRIESATQIQFLSSQGFKLEFYLKPLVGPAGILVEVFEALTFMRFSSKDRVDE